MRYNWGQTATKKERGHFNQHTSRSSKKAV